MTNVRGTPQRKRGILESRSVGFSKEFKDPRLAGSIEDSIEDRRPVRAFLARVEGRARLFL